VHDLHLGPTETDHADRPPEAPEAPARPRWSERAGPIAAVAGVFLAFLAYGVSFAGRYTDDTYITLVYARNLIERHVWGFLPGRVSNTATSPLNVLFEAAFGWVFHSMVGGLVVYTAVLFTVLATLLWRLSRHLFGSVVFGVLATVAFALNPLLFSTIGLESLLLTVVVVAALTCLAFRRWMLLALMCGLAALTRADGALLAVVMVVVVLFAHAQSSRQRLARLGGFVGIVLLVTLPWYGYAWLRLGGIIPDTLLIKRNQSAFWEGRSFADGMILYWHAYPLAVVGSFLLLPLGALLLRGASRRVRVVAGAVLAYGALHFVGYAALGVPPYHWYYTPEMLVTVLLGSLGVAAWLQTRPSSLRWAVPALACLLLVPALGVVRVPPAELPLQSNWGTAVQYREVGEWLRANTPPDAVIRMVGEGGTVSFYAHRTMVNEFTDLDTATRLIHNSADARHPATAALIRFDVRYRPHPPPLPPARYRLSWGSTPPRSARIIKVWKLGTRWRPTATCYLLRE
jgi:hypothetical protein